MLILALRVRWRVCCFLLYRVTENRFICARLPLVWTTTELVFNSNMVQLPDQLVWELTKKNNCFLQKKNGKTDRVGTVSFSKDPGNVKSLHRFQYSSLANSKAVNVTSDSEHRAILVTKTASKADKRTALNSRSLKPDFRRAIKSLNQQTSDVYYRRDLTAAVLGKYTKVYQANRRAKKITKPVKVKMGRGTLNKEE